MIILLKSKNNHPYWEKGVKVYTYYKISTHNPKISKEELQILFCLNGTDITLECEDPNYFYTYIEPRIEVNAWSTNVKTICRKCNFHFIENIKKGTLYMIPVTKTDMTTNIIPEIIFEDFHDKMTEIILSKITLSSKEEYLDDFNKNSNLINEEFKINKCVENYIQGLLKSAHRHINDIKNKGLEITEEIFLNEDLIQSNSEHSRHHFFTGNIKEEFCYKNNPNSNFDKLSLKPSLFKLVKEPVKKFKNNSVLAFCDNSSAIKGYLTNTIIPIWDINYQYYKDIYQQDFVLTAETHNFPTGIAPFPGAATGIGGRIRDVQSTGKGAIPVASSAGYCVGNIDADTINDRNDYPSNMAMPLDILIEASNGASDYGNKFGEPIILGFTRSFKKEFRHYQYDKQTNKFEDERVEWVKPIMFTAGLGVMDHQHIYKEKPIPNLLIAKIGGPVYKVGYGGSQASSRKIEKENADEDFNAVQRDDAEMEQKLNRVIRTCVELGENNPILSIHDQGAGGNGNVLKEILEGQGGVIDLGKLTLGENNLNDLEIWLSEYQESNAILFHPDRKQLLETICRRENVNLDVVGHITGDGKINIFRDDRQIVKDYIHQEDCPKRDYHIREKYYNTNYQPEYEYTCPFLSPTINELIEITFKNLDIGSKRFLTNKVDRSVSGLIAQQQCVGPLHMPISNYGLIASSHFPHPETNNFTGCVTSVGEQPIVGLYGDALGNQAIADKTFAEALLNMVWCGIEDISSIKASANWMWPLPNEDKEEGYKMYKVMERLNALLLESEIAVDGGKDSLSMVVNHNNMAIKGPGSLVLSFYAPVPDINKKVSPLVSFTSSKLYHIDLSCGFRNMGGSCIIRPDVMRKPPLLRNTKYLIHTFKCIQKFIKEGKILAGHDISDGGLITTLLEMALTSNMGITIDIPEEILTIYDTIEYLWNEEIGVVVEIKDEYVREVIMEITSINTIYKQKNKHISPTEKIIIYPIATMRPDDKVIIQHVNNSLLVNIKTKTISVPNTHNSNSNTHSNPHNSNPHNSNFNNNNESTEFPKIITIKKDKTISDIRKLWEHRSMTLDKLQCNPNCVEEEYQLWDNYDINPMTNLLDKHLDYNIPKIKGLFKVGIIREEGSNSDRELASAFYYAGFEVVDINSYDILHNKVDINTFNGLAFCGGFSYADVLGSGKGWALTLQQKKEDFDTFFNRPDTFSIGICNGCQLMSHLGWIDATLEENTSQRFESRFSYVKVNKSNNIFLKDMEDLIFGIWVAHKEGRFVPSSLQDTTTKPIIQYVDNKGEPTTNYPHNPNGSEQGRVAMSSKNNRHLAIMPHPERCFLQWQTPWLSPEDNQTLKHTQFTPWIKLFTNAYQWLSNLDE